MNRTTLYGLDRIGLGATTVQQQQAAESLIKLAANALIASAPWNTMDRKEFFQARDAKLAELKRYGAVHNDSIGCSWTPNGYAYELCQGKFGHTTLPNYIGFDYNHYIKVYQSFLETVYFPVLFKVNPAEFERQVNELGAGTSVPGTNKTLTNFNIDLTATQEKLNALASDIPKEVVVVGGVVAIGLAILLFID